MPTYTPVPIGAHVRVHSPPLSTVQQYRTELGTLSNLSGTQLLQVATKGATARPASAAGRQSQRFLAISQVQGTVVNCSGAAPRPPALVTMVTAGVLGTQTPVSAAARAPVTGWLAPPAPAMLVPAMGYRPLRQVHSSFSVATPSSTPTWCIGLPAMAQGSDGAGMPGRQAV